MIDANVLRSMEHADLLITSDVAGYSTLDFSQFQNIIPKGYAGAQSKTNVLTRFSLTDEDWMRYVARREARRVNSVPTPKFIEIAGVNDPLAGALREALASNIGQPIDTARIEKDITVVMGQGRFHSLNYSLIARDGEQGLLITAEEKFDSPRWLKPGFIINGADPYNVTFTLGARVTFMDVGGYRSEVRIDASFGSIYGLTGAYYHPLTPSSHWFIAPVALATRIPLNRYSGNTLVAEYGVRKAAGGADLGYLFGRFSELRIGYEAGYLSASPRIGSSSSLPSGSSRTGATHLTFAMDRLDDPVVPRRGISVWSNAQWVDAYLGAKNKFPSAEAIVTAFVPTSVNGSVYGVAAGGSTFGYKQTGLPQFSLGAPVRLAAYGLNQFLVDQYFFFRLGYLHEIATLPPFLGSGIYLTGLYEVGKPYGSPNAPRLPNDGAVGLVVKTIFGPLLIGGAVGESGNKKWFFELGRIF
jgi:NTE family protein